MNSSKIQNGKKVAVFLCGSGYKDGSEIRESVGVLWALSKHGAQVRCFAPDAPQADVVNCLSGKVSKGESRNMLVEAARIARGAIEPISNFKPSEFDSVILPGGFGAAKNLCDFAFKGSNGSVRPEIQKALEQIRAANKPIGAVCIAPALVALAFKGKKFKLTVGELGEAAEEIQKLGHETVECPPDRCVVDSQNKIVTTPAYMFDDAPLHLIFEGIDRLVTEVLKL